MEITQTDSDWAANSLFYHIYPLGLCGAPARNDFTAPPVPRLAEIHGWIPHLRELGITALYLGPLFESGSHGYDTTDYFRVDRRLGDHETLAELITALHDNGIRVILDGVFHHVGREFWAFRDLRERGAESAYRDWFGGVQFGAGSGHGDAFTYHGWRGHADLVKLNLRNPAVRSHLFDAVRMWTERFGIDGLRLDVAEDIDPDFLRDLASFCRDLRPDFWLLGEAIHGDYRRLAAPGMLDSATNYEVYKGLYSSHNDRNYHEIAHSLVRQFGGGGMYRGLPLYNFADNHDVTRVASTLREPAHLYPLHLLLLTIPGVPSIYYGSEWGIGGTKRGGDDGPLRPRISGPQDAAQMPHPDIAPVISRLASIRQGSPALRHGDYEQLQVAAEQLAFARRADDDRVVVMVNAAAEPAGFRVAAPRGRGERWLDLLEPGVEFAAHDGRLTAEVPPRWGRILSALR